MGYKDDNRDKTICLKCGGKSVSLDYTRTEHRRMCMGCGTQWDVKHDKDKED